MSVDFTQPPSSASIPDASESVKGKIRIATSAEATAGTDDLTAMTPLKVQSVVNTALVGGVTYQGTFDASSPADLSNASKGDLYIISVAGTYQGQSWAVGDHLLINADMGGTLDPSKIDKVDNTDAVTSVAGRTGAVTLSTADISGLATVASTGAYSDLSGTPTLATVATTGAYSDLSGTPTLGTAAALDVGTSASNVVQLDGTGKLPALDGSQLTNLPAGASALNDLTDVTITGATTGEVLRYNGAEWVDAQLAYSDLSGTPTLATVATTGAYSDLSGTPTNVSTFTNDAGYISDITAENLGDLADVDLTGLADGEIIIYNATSGKWEANPPPAPLATTTSVGLIEIAENAEATAGTATDKALVPSNISSITTAQLDNSAGTMLESANNLSDLANAATARTNLGLGTSATLDVGTSANNVVQLDGTSKLPAIDGSQLTNLPAPTIGLNDLSDVTITAAATGEVLRYNGTAWVDAQLAYSDLSGTPTLATVATTGAYSDLSGTPTNVSTFTNDAGYLTDITAENLGDLADVDLTGLADGEIIIYNATSGKWEANPPPAPLATTTSVGLIEIAENAEATAGLATDKALVPSNISSITTAQFDNSAGTMLESANNLSELTNAATARTNLGLATVASTGAYSDLSGTPTLGTAAALDVGTSANNVVQLNGSAQLPAVDGSLLTGVVADISGASIGDLSDVTITGAATGEVLRYNGTAWVDAQLAYTDVSGLGTAAPLDVGTAANNVVQLNGSAQLPALDGSLLTGVTADLSGATLDDISDVSYPAAPTKDQLLQWNTTTSKWEPVDATTVTSASPGSTYSVTTHKGLEEVYILSPSTSCTVSIPPAADAGNGYKYCIKNLSANTIVINALIDGTSGFNLSAQNSAVTLVSNGSEWFIL